MKQCWTRAPSPGDFYGSFLSVGAKLCKKGLGRALCLGKLLEREAKWMNSLCAERYRDAQVKAWGEEPYG